MSWTERFAADERDSGRVTDVTQHYYVGGEPGEDQRPAGDQQHAVARMGDRHARSGRSPAGTTYTPVSLVLREPSRPGARRRPALPAHRVERLPRRACPGASNAFASALWALDYLHWWAAHGGRGRELPQQAVALHRHDRAGPGRRGRLRGHPQGLRHQGVHPGLGGPGQAGGDRESGRHQPHRLLASAGRRDYVTIINKTHGRGGRRRGRDDRRRRGRAGRARR